MATKPKKEVRTLVYKKTGNIVRPGDIAVLDDGEYVLVRRIREPRHKGSTGRVSVSYLIDGEWACDEMEYYPGVIGAEWRIVMLTKTVKYCNCCGGKDSCQKEKVLANGKIMDKVSEYFDGGKRCHDCGIVNAVGNRHHDGCDMERCHACGGQRISCKCQN